MPSQFGTIQFQYIYMVYQFSRLFHSLIFNWIKRLHHNGIPCSGDINKDINKSSKEVGSDVHHFDVTRYISYLLDFVLFGNVLIFVREREGE